MVELNINEIIRIGFLGKILVTAINFFNLNKLIQQLTVIDYHVIKVKMYLNLF